MPITANEIRKRAIDFSKEWEDESREISEAKSFWDAFFEVFNINRRRVATYEEPVKLLGAKRGRIDLFWKGTLIVEHKSKGENLDAAYSQALDYFPGLTDDDLPKYVLVSDFQRFRIYDLEESSVEEFTLKELHKKIQLFDFMQGYKKHIYQEEDPVNIKAALLMGELHDSLKGSGYQGHPLEVFLSRIMFCLFADDTGIFNPADHFRYHLENRTAPDGSDLGAKLSEIFQTLDTKPEDRQNNLDDDLAAFPYINGKLFTEQLRVPHFNSTMREVLIQCSHFDWSKVSPAVFGSLFQSAMDKSKRKELGAHYTSEKNILKAAKSLFLDDLRAEFEANMNNKRRLNELLKRVSNIKILDPACGCGTFLIICYRELRLLELDIFKQIRKIEGTDTQVLIDVDFDQFIDVDSMYGIELEEFPVRIAEVALWLMDHQMNIYTSEELGYYHVRLPLIKSPHIVQGNALRLNWDDVVHREELSYIIGNPPFAGKKRRTSEQNRDMDLVCKGVGGYGVLDYVCCWYFKANQYIKGTKIKVAFVSTKSINEGEQVGVLWSYLLSEGIRIHFAHRSFSWTNDARGKAAVFVIIIGFAQFDTNNKLLFDYVTPKSDPMAIKAANINPYLVDQVDFVIPSRTAPLCSVPPMVFGSMPNDGGNFLFTDQEKNQFLKDEPQATQFFKPLLSAREYLHNEKRWCIWLLGASPSSIKNCPKVMERIENVKKYRKKSKRGATIRLALTPSLFGEIRQPKSDFVLIPRHSSETRNYIPMGFFDSDNIASDSCSVIPDANLYHFGVMMSSMHMAWVRQICGRIKGDYRYSNNIVYNNFPWPENPSTKNVTKVEELAKKLLEIRSQYSSESLADLYNPHIMPKELIEIHAKLDRAVDKCYRSQPFVSELNRLQFLFGLYYKYSPTNPNSQLEDYIEGDDDQE